MPVITTIDDLRDLAQRRVPKMFFDYADSGSYTEQTLRDNTSDFDKIRLRQRVAVDMEGRSLATQMVGEDVSMPLALAPVGLTGMQHADGEILVAQAAEEAGVPFTLSTMSICSIEDVAENTTKPFWFQLYFMRDRDFIERLIQRAYDAGCSALVLTLDLQILGQRHKDLKNGMTAPPKLTIPNMIDMASKPGWSLGMLGTSRRSFRNIVGHAKGVSDMSSLMSWTSQQFDPRLSWDDVAWIKERWDRKLILKGILDEEDARMAAKTGADAIIVSNHGGRQLDGAPPPIELVGPVAQAVGDRVAVICDGGIRRGSDIVKAVALGADACMVGRAYLYALGAAGERGVDWVLAHLAEGAARTMALTGCRTIADVDRELVCWRGPSAV